MQRRIDYFHYCVLNAGDLRNVVMGYAVVPSESTEHVSWFFDQLREGGWREALDDRGDESCLIVLLDRGTGLVAGAKLKRHCQMRYSGIVSSTSSVISSLLHSRCIISSLLQRESAEDRERIRL